MDFVNPLLILTDLSPVPNKDDTPGFPHSDVDMMSFFPSGVLRGSHSYTSATIEATEVGPLRNETVCYAEWPCSAPKASQLVFKLEPFRANAVRELSYKTVRKWRQTLIENTIGEKSDLHDPRQYLSVLYVELQGGPTPNLEDEASVVHFLRVLRKEMGESDSACVPQFYKDLLVCRGLLADLVLWDVLAIRLTQLALPAQAKPALVAPSSLLELAGIIKLIHRLRSGCARLGAHEILKDSATAQVARFLSTAQPKLHRIRRREWRGVVSAYEKHLWERLTGIDGRQSARVLSEEYHRESEELQVNARTKNDDWLWLSDSLSTSPYRWGTVRSLLNDLNQDGARLSKLSEEMERRDVAIREYIRDYLSAANASGNMVVQRAVVRLTIVAIVLALLSLLATIVSIVATPIGIKFIEEVRSRAETVFKRSGK